VRLFGKPGKAGKASRPEQVDAGNGGRQSGGNAMPGPSIVYGRNPIAADYGRRLFYGSSLTSPMVAGRFRPQDRGAPTNRGGTPDLGPLQAWRGLVGAGTSVRLGAQAGPSSQPGYPGTGSNSVLTGLAYMSQPDVQPIGGLR
jgi:hypothetical protein